MTNDTAVPSNLLQFYQIGYSTALNVREIRALWIHNQHLKVSRNVLLADYELRSFVLQVSFAQYTLLQHLLMLIVAFNAAVFILSDKLYANNETNCFIGLCDSHNESSHG
jgi:hypothetical protein